MWMPAALSMTLPLWEAQITNRHAYMSTVAMAKYWAFTSCCNEGYYAGGQRMGKWCYPEEPVSDHRAMSGLAIHKWHAKSLFILVAHKILSNHLRDWIGISGSSLKQFKSSLFNTTFSAPHPLPLPSFVLRSATRFNVGSSSFLSLYAPHWVP